MISIGEKSGMSLNLFVTFEQQVCYKLKRFPHCYLCRALLTTCHRSDKLAKFRERECSKDNDALSPPVLFERDDRVTRLRIRYSGRETELYVQEV